MKDNGKKTFQKAKELMFGSRAKAKTKPSKQSTKANGKMANGKDMAHFITIADVRCKVVFLKI